MTEIFLAIAIPLLLAEFRALCPIWARALVTQAARRLPLQEQDRYENEWLGEIEMYEKHGSRVGVLIFAVGIRFGARGLGSVLLEEDNSANALESSDQPSTRELGPNTELSDAEEHPTSFETAFQGPADSGQLKDRSSEEEQLSGEVLPGLHRTLRDAGHPEQILRIQQTLQELIGAFESTELLTPALEVQRAADDAAQRFSEMHQAIADAAVTPALEMRRAADDAAQRFSEVHQAIADAAVTPALEMEQAVVEAMTPVLEMEQAVVEAMTPALEMEQAVKDAALSPVLEMQRAADDTAQRVSEMHQTVADATTAAIVSETALAADAALAQQRLMESSAVMQVQRLMESSAVMQMHWLLDEYCHMQRAIAAAHRRHQLEERRQLHRQDLRRRREQARRQLRCRCSGTKRRSWRGKRYR